MNFDTIYFRVLVIIVRVPVQSIKVGPFVLGIQISACEFILGISAVVCADEGRESIVNGH